jgi:hypothetical protein
MGLRQQEHLIIAPAQTSQTLRDDVHSENGEIEVSRYVPHLGHLTRASPRCGAMATGTLGGMGCRCVYTGQSRVLESLASDPSGTRPTPADDAGASTPELALFRFCSDMAFALRLSFGSS